MKNLATVSVFALLIGASAPAALAQGDIGGHLSFGVGYYDILDDEGAADFRVEYRPNSRVFVDNLKPWIGIEVTSDASLWGGVGLLYDWEVSPNLHVIPNFGAGLYAQGSSDLDLGHTIEFRSQLEVAYEFESKDRLGVAFGHLSNASLDSHNPGTEVLSLYWHQAF